MNNVTIVVVGLTVLLAQLTQAAPSQTNPVTTPVTYSAATTAVQQYLSARNAGHYAQAYALLSTITQGMLPLGQFESKPNLPTNPTADGMTPLLSALAAFFVDPHNTLGYRFFVVGALSTAPDTVLVRACAVGASDIMLLKVVVTTASAAGGPPHLDFMQSAMLTDAPGIVGASQKAKEITSSSNLKQIELGILQYAEDHDETYPDAANWIDEILPYLGNRDAVFHDPSAPAGENWSYALNSNLSGKPLAQFDAPADTVAVFESNADTKNASDTGESVPIPGRHMGGTDYAFADGHVKWFPDGTKLSYQLSGK
jgi:prepilin-type processing-associated H-X9-DG protein